VDYFNNWIEADAFATVTSKDIIFFLVNVFSRLGLSQIINMDDNGPQLECDYTKIFLDLYDVYIHFGVYHPPSNGLVENRNREIEKKLRNFLEDNENWDLLLPLILWALRTSKSVVIGYSSFELFYGREDSIPTDVIILNSITGLEERDMEELLVERFLEHAEWVKNAAIKKLGTINYWRTRIEAKCSMENKNN